MIGNREIIDAVKLLRSQYDFGIFEPIQRAAIAALEGPLESVREQCARYQERRDALCGGLRSIGWDVRDSQGTMFAWARIPEGFSSSQQFVMELMDKTGVICTPGDAFGSMGEGYVRFALVLPPGKDSGNDRGHRSKRHPETAVSNRKKEPAREQTLYLPRTGSSDL